MGNQYVINIILFPKHLYCKSIIKGAQNTLDRTTCICGKESLSLIFFFDKVSLD